ALRSQCTIQSQSATLTGLSLTRCLVSSVLAIESRTRPLSYCYRRFCCCLSTYTSTLTIVVLYLAPSKMEQYLSVRLAVAAEDTPAEPSEPIELDSDDKNNSDGDDYAAF